MTNRFIQLKLVLSLFLLHGISTTQAQNDNLKSFKYVELENEINSTISRSYMSIHHMKFINGEMVWLECDVDSSYCEKGNVFRLEMDSQGIVISFYNKTTRDSVQVPLFSFKDTLEMLEMNDLNQGRVVYSGICYFQGLGEYRVSSKKHECYVFVAETGKVVLDPHGTSIVVTYFLDSKTLIPIAIRKQRRNLADGQFDKDFVSIIQIIPNKE